MNTPNWKIIKIKMMKLYREACDQPFCVPEDIAKQILTDKFDPDTCHPTYLVQFRCLGIFGSW